LLYRSVDRRAAMPGTAGGHTSREPITSGLLSFAGFLIWIVGFFNIVDGLTSLSKRSFYLVPSSKLLIFDFTVWGWIWIIVGILQIFVGASILARRTWARTAGIALILLAIAGQFAFMNTFPLWSMVIIAVSLVAIYLLMVPTPGSLAH
jgi:hypothetical protein